ncbi:MAG: hypothetical protein U0804_00020 [Gemmataceae bacterium]
MHRATIGAATGITLGLAALAGYGAWWGLTAGVNWRHPLLPPGWDAAAVNATVMLLYFWWAAVAVGGGIGAAAGLGSWLVRPRRRVALA